MDGPDPGRQILYRQPLIKLSYPNLGSQDVKFLYSFGFRAVTLTLQEELTALYQECHFPEIREHI